MVVHELNTYFEDKGIVLDVVGDMQENLDDLKKISEEQDLFNLTYAEQIVCSILMEQIIFLQRVAEHKQVPKDTLEAVPMKKGSFMKEILKF